MADWKSNADMLEAIAAGAAMGVSPRTSGSALQAIANDIRRELLQPAPAAVPDATAEASAPAPEDPNAIRARALEEYFSQA